MKLFIDLLIFAVLIIAISRQIGNLIKTHNLKISKIVLSERYLFHCNCDFYILRFIRATTVLEIL